MPPTTTGTRTALQGLGRALEAPRKHGAQAAWRHSVRQGLTAVREHLAREQTPGADSWLSARSHSVSRERAVLLGRLAMLGPQVSHGSELDRVHAELQRLLSDVHRHLQRLSDLAYDEVELELELGGSE